MADKAAKAEKPQATEGADPPAAAGAKKKSPIKMLAIVGVLMAGEAAGVYVVVGMLGPKPAPAKAELHADEHDALDALVEIPLVDEQFQNMQTGHIWVWDLQIVLKVRKRHEDAVKHTLEARAAEIKEGVAQIVKRAQHAHLKEVDLRTLNRQLTAYLNKIIEPDPEGDSRIDRVLIPKCKGFQFEG